MCGQLLFDNDGYVRGVVTCGFSSRSLRLILPPSSTITNSMPGVEAAWNMLGNEYGFEGKEAADCGYLSIFGLRVLP